ncbi:MAG: ribonuclease H-like domain-containing protein, partial [Gammaproteobacteria bacterium]|nr:ribonuclease H-like domain-containing protein [Gammaproteobacteria bacterium]
MDNLLKKRLALIKARANRFKSFRLIDSITQAPMKKVPIDAFELDTGVPGGCLEELVRGEERDIEGRQFYLVRLKGSEFDQWAQKEAMSFRSPRKEQAEKRKNPVTGSLLGADPIEVPKENVCFFDIETTGLTPSTTVFLCGMMFLEENDFIFELAFARDYEEEGGMLHYVRKKFEDFDSVVTFNGKSFDIPFVKTRMAVNRIDFEESF